MTRSIQTILETSLPAGPQGAQGVQGAQGNTGSSGDKERRHDWVSPYSYCGTAVLGSSNSASVWSITRIQVSVDGATTKTYATNVAWDDHLTETYT